MQIHIATLFDKNHIVKTLAFYNALIKLGQNYKFWFLCLDEDTKKTMQKMNLHNVSLYTLKDINDRELLETKSNRSTSEYIFTSKSAFLDFIQKQLLDGELLIFSDNDIIFFLPPDKILERMKSGGNSIGITAHRFFKNQEYMNNRVGKYNAGLFFFIMNKSSRKCISNWRKDCIDWCYLLYEKERFGDQKYIVKWPQRYAGVYEIPDKGVNAGNWNIANWRVSKKGEQFFIDADPLICYHFHRIRFYINGGNIKPLPIYIYHPKLYSVYTAMIENSWKEILKFDSRWKHGFVEKPNIFRILKQKITARIRTIRGNKSDE